MINGPESNGRRTQWLKRLVALSDAYQLDIQLAYYPPYHSKYNPVERLWGVLENHWRGEIIDSVEKALGLARSMTYRHLKPSVRKVCKVYRKGVSVAKQAMQDIEATLDAPDEYEDIVASHCTRHYSLAVRFIRTWGRDQRDTGQRSAQASQAP